MWQSWKRDTRGLSAWTRGSTSVSQGRVPSADRGVPVKDTGGAMAQPVICPWDRSLTEKPNEEEKAGTGPSIFAFLKITL